MEGKNHTFKKAILHLDGDAFFASVEVAKNPKLRGLPVVTGHERGIASSMSYEAKRAGVKRGMPIYQIRKACAEAIIVHSDYEAYVEYSKKMMKIVRRYTDEVEEYSIDECFADLTGYDRVYKKSYLEIMQEIQAVVLKELDISVSLGLAENKVLAKVASKWQKPGGVTVIFPDEQANFLSKTPVENIWGIGPRSAVELKNKGVHDAFALASQTESWVNHNFNKHLYEIWQELRGGSVLQLDLSDKNSYQSITRTETFFDYKNMPINKRKPFLLSELARHVEDACRKARRYSLEATHLHFFLKDSNFRIKSAEIKFDQPTNLPPVIMDLIRKNFDQIFDDGKSGGKSVEKSGAKTIAKMYRTAGITLLGLKPNLEQDFQADLFGDNTKNIKIKKIYQTVDEINQKFGDGTVQIISSNAQKPRGGFGKN